MSPSELKLVKGEVYRDAEGFFEVTQVKVIGGWNDYTTSHLRFLGWPDRSLFSDLLLFLLDFVRRALVDQARGEVRGEDA